MIKLDLLIVGFSVVLAGFLALEMGISTVIAELLAGIIVGNILPFEFSELILLLAEFGIVVLMYLAGLEVDFGLLRENYRASLTVGSVSFFVPAAIVFSLSYYYFSFTMMQSLLIMIAMSTTSIAIIYPLLMESDRVMDRTNKVILASAMVTDMLSIVALGVFFSSYSFYTLLFVLLFIFVGLFFSHAGERLFKRCHGNISAMEFRLVLLVLLGLAVLSESAGIEGILVAFFFGVITSELVSNHEKLVEQLRGIAFGFLTPIFFFTTGAKVAISAIIENIMLMLGFLLAGFGGKYIGTFIAAKRFFPGKEHFVASLFNARLSVGLVAALVGLNLEIITPEIFSAIVGAIIISTFLAAYVHKKMIISGTGLSVFQ